MKFGVCCDTSVASIAAAASYDYAESSVKSLLVPEQTEDEFLKNLDKLKEVGLPYYAANCFLPAELKVTGLDVNTTALRRYITTCMKRAKIAGVKIIVFGSGVSRRVPDDLDRKKAHDQLVAFCKMLAMPARDNGVTIAIEPLNTSECNILNTVSECAELVKEVAEPAIRLLVDSYHLMHDKDSYDDIVKYADILAHVHIATVPNRLPPSVEVCDFTKFFAALADANYSGGISIEAKIKNPQEELPAALVEMKRLSKH